MKARKVASIIILLASIGIGAFVIYDTNSERAADDNKQRLNQYLESDGIEREEIQTNETEETDSSPETGGMQVGTEASDFELKDIDRETTVSLSDFEGKYVVLNMWASWCPPCRDEMPDFIDFYEKYRHDGVEVIGINMTTQERNSDDAAQFVSDFNVPFLTLIDEDGFVLDEYEVNHMPTTYMIDPDGKVAMRRPGLINYNMLEDYYKDIKEEYEKGA